MQTCRREGGRRGWSSSIQEEAEAEESGGGTAGACEKPCVLQMESKPPGRPDERLGTSTGAARLVRLMPVIIPYLRV